MKQNRKITYILICLCDYLLYSIIASLLYYIFGKILTDDYLFNLKDFLIIPVAPLAIIFTEGFPYFLIFNFLLIFILLFIMKKRFFISYIIATIISHFIQYAILLLLNWDDYIYISMNHDDVHFNKILVIIPSVIITIIIIYFVFQKSIKRLDQEYGL